MKTETFKAKVIANAYLLKNKFGENCKGHNRQLIATVLPLFFAIKTVLPKSQNTINDAALLLRKFADKPQMCHNNV